VSKSKIVLGLVLTWLICVSPAAFANPWATGAAHAAAQACNPGNAVFCGSLGGGGGAGGGAGAGGAGAGGAGAGGAGTGGAGAGGAGGAGAGGAGGAGAGGAAGTTSASSAGGAGGGSAGTTSASSSASGSNSGNYSGGSGSGTSKLGSFVFVAVAGLMIYVIYMDDKCRRTPGCKPDQTLPTTNAVDGSGDKILTAWNTGPNWP
jgi:hypothetical protein